MKLRRLAGVFPDSASLSGVTSMERLDRPVLVDDRRWGLVSFRRKGKKKPAAHGFPISIRYPLLANVFLIPKRGEGGRTWDNAEANMFFSVTKDGWTIVHGVE
jgi:hypothetical protein